jgi:hypothetical protein
VALAPTYVCTSTQTHVQQAWRAASAINRLQPTLLAVLRSLKLQAGLHSPRNPKPNHEPTSCSSSCCGEGELTATRQQLVNTICQALKPRQAPEVHMPVAVTSASSISTLSSCPVTAPVMGSLCRGARGQLCWLTASKLGRAGAAEMAGCLLLGCTKWGADWGRNAASLLAPALLLRPSRGGGPAGTWLGRSVLLVRERRCCGGMTCSMLLNDLRRGPSELVLAMLLLLEL